MSAEQDYLDQLRAMHQADGPGRAPPFASAPNLASHLKEAKAARTPLERPVQAGSRREPITAATASEGQRPPIQAAALSPAFRRAEQARQPLQAPSKAQTPRTTSIAKVFDAPRTQPAVKPNASLGAQMLKRQQPAPSLRLRSAAGQAVDRATFGKKWMAEQARAGKQNQKLKELYAKMKEPPTHASSQEQGHSNEQARGRGR